MNPIIYADIADAAEILELQKLAYQSEAAIYERLGYTIFDRKPLSDLVELVFMEKLKD